MNHQTLTQRASDHLRRICVEIGSRPVGSSQNREATAYFADTARSFGLDVQCPSFPCVHWSHAGADVTLPDSQLEAFPSPYSLGCSVRAPLHVASSMDELLLLKVAGEILLLRGDIAREQLMPKNFSFYNPEQHQQLIRLLEHTAPAAIIVATSRDTQMVGSQYPFPLFEDGDFDIPSVYLSDTQGELLAGYAGRQVYLQSRARRLPAIGNNVLARRGRCWDQKVAVLAHIDSRLDTPGALDNASGTVVLLLLCELLSSCQAKIGIEIVAMNGEDYYANPGEQQYLAANEGLFRNIVLGINIDDVGYVRGRVAYSLYGCPTDLAQKIEEALASCDAVIPGDPWYQGDHGLFLMHETPALAMTSELGAELMATVTHTPRDTYELVDLSKLVLVAQALHALVRSIAAC